MARKRRKTIWFLIAIAAALSAGVFAGGYMALASGIPSIEELKQYKSMPGTKVYADDDSLIGELKIEKGMFAPLDKMPEHLINAVVSVEDSRFWKHKGIDYLGILRAGFKDIIHVGLKEGGSTITQQLAKITFLTSEKKISRKLKEVFLAFKIENSLTKKEILELYLNKIYLGHGAYGVEMASRVYFGKSVRAITLPEAALIVGLIKAPSIYSPYNNLMKSRERQEIVLSRMEDEGYIKQAEKEKALKQPLYLSNSRRGLEANNYFTEYIRKQLEDKYGMDVVYKQGLKVYTTLDRKAQDSAAKALQDGLREFDKRRGWRGAIEHKEVDVEKALEKKEAIQKLITNTGDIVSGVVLKVSAKSAIIRVRGLMGKLPVENALWASTVMDPKTGKTRHIDKFSLDKILKVGDVIKVGHKPVKGGSTDLTLEQEPEVEGAVVALEPSTGFIRAMVGGYDYSKSEFNRVLFAKRQPGSAFKPIIYAAAMDSGFTPASIIIDEPATYKGGPKGEWTPENYDHKHYGPTRLREALAYSRNVVTVKLLDTIGVDRVIELSRKLGFEGDIPRNLSIALGSINATPMELANGYGVFANSGMKMKSIAIKHITDSKGGLLESNTFEGEQKISPETAFLTTSMMEDVVKYGTGWRIKALGRPVAGKTGTTNDYRDAWFVGYTPEMVSCVWVGFDDMRPLGNQETGAKAASPIWLNFMKPTVSPEVTAFHAPEGIVSYQIDPVNGLLSRNEKTSLKEYFKVGTQPKEYSSTDGIREMREPDGYIDFD